MKISKHFFSALALAGLTSAPALANLWPAAMANPALVASGVADLGQFAGVACNPGQIIVGTCAVAGGVIAPGWAEIGLRFVDQNGAALAYGNAFPGGQARVANPINADLAIMATAPMGTVRAELYVRTTGNAAGASATFNNLEFDTAQ